MTEGYSVLTKSLRVRSHLTTTMRFFCRHVQTYMLVVMQPISENMLPMSKICVAVTKCERALTYNYNYHCSVMVIALDS